ncbi:hypothetical protein AS156_36565 [Bradyrhizobium macuxiense]|uniref:Uncharacterized protein n=1 Tax=Bradyrhizobium macuxiense TaxID=1755647 RepID=A0A109K018_9BRAD|nr:hypothetical protein AS156_36565 [Bradyrhizobium macuxiense]
MDPDDADAPDDLLVAGASVSGQQDLRPLELAGHVLATAQKHSEFGAFGLAEVDAIAYIHPCVLLSRH